MVPEIVKSVIREYCVEHTDTSEEFNTCYDRAIERYEADQQAEDLVPLLQETDTMEEKI